MEFILCLDLLYVDCGNNLCCHITFITTLLVLSTALAFPFSYRTLLHLSLLFTLLHIHGNLGLIPTGLLSLFLPSYLLHPDRMDEFVHTLLSSQHE